jgi:hypothetical protein
MTGPELSRTARDSTRAPRGMKASPTGASVGRRDCCQLPVDDAGSSITRPGSCEPNFGLAPSAGAYALGDVARTLAPEQALLIVFEVRRLETSGRARTSGVDRIFHASLCPKTAAPRARKL